MNVIRDSVSIKDLENLSGIKAHTIRIWEKRYNLLTPDRTDTNIRTYSIKSLQKLLNISLLYENGYKISKIAQLEEEQIPVLVREIASNKNKDNHALSAFKLSMLNYDQVLFYHTYNSLLAHKSFREIFHDNFIPLLNEIGMLWQTDTISPANEHFISNLIKQKILSNIEMLQSLAAEKRNRTFVLYLPENEIHELGLLYVHYELLLNGYISIYLGPTVPYSNLTEINATFDNIIYISYFTVEPNRDKIIQYLENFNNLLLTEDNPNELWIFGFQTNNLSKSELPERIKRFDSISTFIKEL